MFASLVLEREPLKWDDLPGVLVSWLQTAGLVALIGLVLWLIARTLFRRSGYSQRATAFYTVMLAATLVSILADVSAAVLGFQRGGPSPLFQVLLTAGGTLALLVVIAPVALAFVLSIRWRRIWALARLSMKEAIRGRVLWVFTIVALIFLFAGYFVSYKPEDQIRNYVLIVYYATAPLFLLLAALLGSFSIPNDVTKQTIHTIVTKPVERYEIVLGRFLGYGILLSLALAAVTALSLIYVARGVTREAAQESYKARVPLFGDTLTFWGTKDPTKGESVGREWDYRSYIRGKALEGGIEAPRQYAIWSFNSLPSSFASRTEPVPFEFTFDIFRTLKGGEGVFCTLTFAEGAQSVPQIENNVEKLREARTKGQARLAELASAKKARVKTREEEDGVEDWLKEETQKLEDQLIAQHKVFEASGVQVVDYHTEGLQVPASLFKSVSEARQNAAQAPAGETPPVLKVLVTVGDDSTSRSQMLGVAKRDLYLLAAELPFWQNFFKGALGLWLSVLLVLGLAVACSTYLSGIISMLCTLFLFGAGMVVDYVKTVAEGRSEGGGPIEAATRLYYHLPIGAPLDQTPTTSLARGFDAFYRVLLGTTLKVIPDVTRYNLTDYVANGFDIPWGQVLFLDNFVPMLAYLVPWAVLAYYMINSREVANPS